MEEIFFKDGKSGQLEKIRPYTVLGLVCQLSLLVTIIT